MKGLEGVRFPYLSRKREVNGLIVRQNCQATKNPMETFLSGRAAELTGTSPRIGFPEQGEGPCYSVGKSPTRRGKSTNHLSSIALRLLVA